MVVRNSLLIDLIQSGEIGISPFNSASLKESSFTFTLDKLLTVFLPSTDPIDLRNETPHGSQVMMTKRGYVLVPGQFVLGQTAERLRLGSDYCCFLSARRSCAKIGLGILQGSFFAEPMTDDHLVLEISNNSQNAIVLFPGLPIVKGVFATLDEGREIAALRGAQS